MNRLIILGENDSKKASSTVSATNELITDAVTSVLTNQFPSPFADFAGNGFSLTDDDVIFLQSTDTMGYVSSAISNEEGTFDTPIQITVNFAEKVQPGYTFNDITLYFDNTEEIEFTITYYNGASIIKHTLVKSEGTTHFSNNVGYPALYAVIDITKTAPNTRIKLERIDFDRTAVIDTFKKVGLLEEGSLDSWEVPINELSVECVYDVDLAEFDKNKCLFYRNDEQKGEFVMGVVTKAGEDYYKFDCQDTISVLQKATYDKLITETTAGLINANEYHPVYPNYTGRFRNINGTNLKIEDALSNAAIKGMIRDNNARVLLRDIGFAIGAFIDSTGEGITLRKPQTTPTHHIPSERIIGNAIFTESTPKSGIYLESTQWDVADTSETIYFVQTTQSFSTADAKPFDTGVYYFDKPFKTDNLPDDIEITLTTPNGDNMYLSADEKNDFLSKYVRYLTERYIKMEGTFDAESSFPNFGWGITIMAKPYVSQSATYDTGELNSNSVTKKYSNTAFIGQTDDTSAARYSKPLVRLFGGDNTDPSTQTVISWEKTLENDYIPSLINWNTTLGQVKAKVVLNGEKLYDLVTIETKYSGTAKGYIKKMDHSMIKDDIADVVIEVVEIGE